MKDISTYHMVRPSALSQKHLYAIMGRHLSDLFFNSTTIVQVPQTLMLHQIYC